MLRPKLVENRSAAARIISDKLNLSVALDRMDELVGKAFVDGERLLENYAGELPVTVCGVFAG